MTRIFGKKGPTLLDKNIGRNWLKAGAGTTPHQGDREIARRLKQEAARRAKADKGQA